MRTLEQSLQDEDLGRLRVIAELWGLDPPAGARPQAVAGLLQAMSEPQLAIEIFESLPSTSQQALQVLLSEGGRLPWADFTQRFGAVREMGPGRRDREKPWRDPISATERLLYHGFIGRAFADSPVGVKEFAYIPTDLQPVLPQAGASTAAELGHALGKPEHVLRTSSGLVDDVTTLLAALRQEPAGSELSSARQRQLAEFFVYPGSLPLLPDLLRQLGLLQRDHLTPVPEQVGPFLAERRDRALEILTAAWRDSTAWNDLTHLTHLEPGPLGWPNDPHAGRLAALDLIARVPVGPWWDLDSFIRDVKDHYPSFLRTGGDFDSWYLRDRRTGAFLQGIESWETVDGALLRALLTGPLHWLGAADLGSAEADRHIDRIRLTPWSQVLLEQRTAPELREPAAKGRVYPDGRVQIPRAAPRDLRYQLARLGTWLDFDGTTYSYRLRPSSVLASAEQGLQPRHIQQLLAKLTEVPVPPPLLTALDRLSERGIEGRLERATLLRFPDSDLLDRLIERPGFAALILERLGPTAALVDPHHVGRLLRAAAEGGVLIEPPVEGER